MKKSVSELSRQNVNNCQEDTIGRDNKQYCFLNRLNVSETERGVLARMNRCTPDNELHIRGFQ